MEFFLKKGNNIDLEAFVDGIWAKDIEIRRSTSGYFLKIENSPMSWCGRRQFMVTLFMNGAEYYALMEGTKKVVWLRNLLTKIGHIKLRPMTLFCDNISIIKMAKNQVFHARTKHI
jgi:hypothetical protein